MGVINFPKGERLDSASTFTGPHQSEKYEVNNLKQCSKIIMISDQMRPENLVMKNKKFEEKSLVN
jgi:hypothetical protein